ncbi:outer membrane lipoprotein-sorting protein [Psychromarinibacter sp. C21-152]|uniref:Outer membrane lipoprotein-sorting protein n=1 Tax=Psychromarinibacter sediminicola TaxID=3033385 RepID=A0AAE3NTT2_9RHOB|nr:outer membrane lipoprotein-sorting protein [Psychromarinibacter sediminicola]MDF0601876.1 outer membrane lipoprotein-sorting protein [Psychromarinibacter sediminicola]
MHLTRRVLLTGAAAAALVPSAVAAQSAREKGERIAREAAARTEGYGDLSATGEMILKSAGGQTSTRRFDVKWVETGGGASRSLLVFNWPGDIRNTALLTHSYEGRSDDQWLWLPSLNKVRRISSSGRSGSFVGSEFAYEDMTDQEVEEFTHTWVQDGAGPGGIACHIVDRRPKSASGYSLQRVWFDRQHLRVQQVQYFDRRGAHLKTLRVSGYRLYQGRFWRAGRMDMQNHLTGKATTLTWSNYRFDTGVNPNVLTPNALKRIR